MKAKFCFTHATAAAVLACSGMAATPAADAASYLTSAADASYSGADRTQHLIAEAKQEGSALTVYSSQPPDDINPVIQGFEKKYGIKVTIWRASASGILQRAVAESRAHRYDADVFETNGPQLEAMFREKILQPVVSPVQSQLIPQAKQEDGSWTASRLNIFSIAYNTNLIKKADLPKTYADLADPKWKGKLGVEGQDSVPWFAYTIKQLGGQPGIDLFKKIVATNGVAVRNGHTLVSNLVASGDIPMAFGPYNYKIQSMKESGAPIDWFVIGPAVTQPNGIGVAATLKHPAAALLFYDYLLTDGQQFMANRDYAVVNINVKSKLPAVPMEIISNKEIIDNQVKNQAAFDAVFKGM